MNAKRILPLMLVSACFAGTAFAGGPDVPPPAKIARPWTQVRQAWTIPAGAHVSIEVTGETPLAGGQTLLRDALSARLTSLLARRGCVVVSKNPDYLVRLTFGVTPHDAQLSSGGHGERGSAWVTGASTASGLGTAAARLAETALFAAMVPGQPETPVTVRYTHTVLLEISDPKGALVWKGDGSWESTAVDPEREITPPLTMLLSTIPATGDVVPKVKQVRENAAATYWTLNVDNTWIMCPALPHGILTRRELSSKEPAAALAAVVDLLQTAEYAVPDGKEDYDNPLGARNWEKALIGGTYLIGDDPAPQYILAWLEQSPSGYTLEKFRIVTDSEYAKFSLRLDEWKTALAERLPMFAE